MSRLLFTQIFCVVLLCGSAIVADAPTPLKDSIEALNAKTAAGYFDQEGYRTTPLTKDRWPAPTTVDDVVAAIRGWDRTRFPVDDATYRIYQQIAETRLLPPGAELYFRDEWEHADKQDRYEHRVWRIQLDVMTGKNTGYGFPISEQKIDRRMALVAAPGYSWLLDPRPVTIPAGWTGPCVVMVDKANNELVVTAGLSRQKGLQDVHVVAFDAQGKRHVLDREPRWGGATSEFAMYRFRLASLSADDASFIGVEALSTEGLKQSSEVAVRRAKQQMIEVLPLPEVGHPFEFSLTATDGTKIESSKLRGKVVLIDCWASWCGPCIREFPDVKKVFDKWRGAGLEVIGLSLDSDTMTAVAAAKMHEIPWPIVIVPSGADARQLWTEASRIESIPRILLVDQKGVLSADLSSAEKLEEAVAALLDRK